jgi:hypothetical protein
VKSKEYNDEYEINPCNHVVFSLLVC